VPFLALSAEPVAPLFSRFSAARGPHPLTQTSLAPRRGSTQISIVKLVYFVFYVVLGLFDFSLLVVGL
jgi:hypothetical protein